MCAKNSACCNCTSSGSSGSSWIPALIMGFAAAAVADAVLWFVTKFGLLILGGEAVAAFALVIVIVRAVRGTRMWNPSMATVQSRAAVLAQAERAALTPAERAALTPAGRPALTRADRAALTRGRAPQNRAPQALPAAETVYARITGITGPRKNVLTRGGRHG
jgi:hypothetical protein